MKLRTICLACVLCLLLPLTACTPVSENSATPPVSETVSPTPTAAQPSPLTKEDVRALFEDEGNYMVLSITPSEGDYLAEITDHAGDKGWRALYWVFGESGHKVWLNREITEWEIDTYKITTPGTVEITTTGENTNVPAKRRGPSYTAVITVDSRGRLLPDYEEGQSVVLWENQAHGGWLLLDDPGHVSGESEFSGRYEQIYEARIGIDDIALSFIPSSAPGRFQTFFPASTSAPTSDCSFDPETRVFTIRLYNTTLKSGAVSEEDLEWAGRITYGDLYPRTIPEGSLGQGNHFIESATIAQDGEDAVITLTLTDAGYAYQSESGNMGQDNFPYLRYSFREQNHQDD